MMFMKNDRIHLNGDLDRIKGDIVQVTTELRAHQAAFEKHEKRDDERFRRIDVDVKQFHHENTEQHDNIIKMIIENTKKVTWLLGIGITVWVVVQLVFSGAIQLSVGG